MITDRIAVGNALIVELTEARDAIFTAFQEASRLRSSEADNDGYAELREHVKKAHEITGRMVEAVAVLERPPG